MQILSRLAILARNNHLLSLKQLGSLAACSTTKRHLEAKLTPRSLRLPSSKRRRVKRSHQAWDSSTQHKPSLQQQLDLLSRSLIHYQLQTALNRHRLNALLLQARQHLAVGLN